MQHNDCCQKIFYKPNWVEKNNMEGKNSPKSCKWKWDKNIILGTATAHLRPILSNKWKTMNLALYVNIFIKPSNSQKRLYWGQTSRKKRTRSFFLLQNCFRKNGCALFLKTNFGIFLRIFQNNWKKINYH